MDGTSAEYLTDMCTCLCADAFDADTATSVLPIVYDLAVPSSGCAAGPSVGTMQVDLVDDSTVSVAYDLYPGFVALLSHFYIGSHPLPSDGNGGYLAPDNFPHGHASTAASASFTVDTSSCDFYIAAHAKVCGRFPLIDTPSPTALPSKSPSESPSESPSNSPTDCECPPGCYPEDEEPLATISEPVRTSSRVQSSGGGGSETAFAYHHESPGNCFEDDGFSRWGWTIGPLVPGVYHYPIYAGAGQCDLTKGALVGQLRVEFTGASVKAHYQMDNGYILTETHLYVGDTPYPMSGGGNPKPNVSPGQYTAIHDSVLDNTQDSYNLAGVDVDDDGHIYVIAHAVTSATARRHLTEAGCTCVCPSPSPSATPSMLPSSSPSDPPIPMAPPKDTPAPIPDFPPVDLPQKCVGPSGGFSGGKFQLNAQSSQMTEHFHNLLCIFPSPCLHQNFSPTIHYYRSLFTLLLFLKRPTHGKLECCWICAHGVVMYII